MKKQTCGHCAKTFRPGPIRFWDGKKQHALCTSCGRNTSRNVLPNDEEAAARAANVITKNTTGKGRWSKTNAQLLLDATLEVRAEESWRAILGRNPTDQELEALVRFGRTVEATVRRKAADMAADWDDQVDDMVEKYGLAIEEGSRLRQVRFAAALFRAFSKFRADPLGSAIRSVHGRDSWIARTRAVPTPKGTK